MSSLGLGASNQPDRTGLGFINTAKAVQRVESNYYGFDHAPILLFEWSCLFQSVISQAGTYLLTKKFHTQQCAIYKAEGGCRIVGMGDLVLHDDYCTWDMWGGGKRDKTRLAKLAKLITTIVLEWDPINPIDSMLASASKVIKVKADKLREAVHNSSNGHVFGGNALSDFFDWNPFSKPIYNRDYDRYCKKTFLNTTDQEIDQEYADADLADSLKERLDEAITKKSTRYVGRIIAISPSRHSGQLQFFINAGGVERLSGWKTKEDLEAFILSDEPLVRNS